MEYHEHTVDLNDIKTTAPSVSGVDMTAPQPQPIQHHNKKRILLIVGGCFVVLVLAAGGIYWWLHRPKQNAETVEYPLIKLQQLKDFSQPVQASVDERAEQLRALQQSPAVIAPKPTTSSKTKTAPATTQSAGVQLQMLTKLNNG